jgi:predicted lysophospholipase L1 biosynthesis ABC-type transport system permease subunit
VNQPSRRDRLKPVELLVLSAILSLFVGLTVLLTTRDPILAAIFFGVAFIVVLVVMAMFSLSIKPNEMEQHEIDDEDSDHPKGH